MALGRLAPGDLVFFDADSSDGTQIDHVGIYLGRDTGGNYRFFGGGAGDDGLFQTTHVFAGRHARTDAVAALEILSSRPVGVGVAHGWEPAGQGMRVTEAEGNRLVVETRFPLRKAVSGFAPKHGRADLLTPEELDDLLGYVQSL